MDFGLSEEQRLIVETTRAFVENELYPHEAEVERTGVCARNLPMNEAKGNRGWALRSQHAGRVGGAGLDTVTWLLYEKELAAPIMRCTGPASAVPRTSCLPEPPRRRKSTYFPAFAAKNRIAWR